MLTRRQLLIGGGGLLAAGALGAGALELAPQRVKVRLGLADVPDVFIPDAPEGRVRLEKVRSAAMGADMELFTAVPQGYGTGAGLPVVVILHGASSSAADFQGFGFGRFLTAAVRRGAAPFVLAGTDDGPGGWVADGSGPDPMRMLLHEMPGWLAERGFDSGRRALWGWSLGGYGILRLVEESPHWAKAAAVFSPAITSGDVVFDHLEALAEIPLGVWCGYSDPYFGAVHDLVGRLPTKPAILTYADGGHTYQFWNDHTLAAFRWLASQL